jgi:predicted PolB exonuclease-like 3'-5' exonuclease
MKIPDKVFADIAKIDFIKIDVEGYEHLVFENMIQTIEKHKPLIQSELSGKENRQSVISILKSLGYKTCILKNNNIVEASSKDIENHEQDFYFKPIKNEES